MQEENLRAKRARALSVDDSPLIQAVVTATLEARGFSVRTVDSGFAALEACREETFDVVVLDVEMPGEIDGLVVGRSLRADPRNSGAMIAMHTGLDEQTVRHGFCGYDVFLAKPCDAIRLGACVDSHLLRCDESR